MLKYPRRFPQRISPANQHQSPEVCVMTFAISRYLLLASVISVFGPVSFAPASAQTSSTIRFGASSYAVREGAGGVPITVTRSGDTAGAVTVDYATSSATASERTDFIPALGTLRFAPGA